MSADADDSGGIATSRYLRKALGAENYDIYLDTDGIMPLFISILGLIVKSSWLFNGIIE